MAKVLPFSLKTKNSEADKSQQEDLFNQALTKAKATSKVDYYKVLTSDEKETQRLRMKQHQERLDLY